ncbi:phosphoribosyltransferase family protein [Terrabacter sp. NPDC000476]|uniref:ComF family protein n=1 Tax=Terrabacter sp. NPDC000476 TaxID=3154258 RepID=UPI00332FCCE6
MDRIRALPGAALDLVLPRECGGCRRAGTRWCTRCATALASLALGDPPGASGPSWVVPHRPPPGLPPVHAWGLYADPLRVAVSAWKDAGRRDLERVLAPLLAASLAGALAGCGWPDGVVLVVPVPSSPRSVRARGDTPMVDVCAAALDACMASVEPGATPGRGVVAHTLRLAPALRHARRVADQSGLDTAQRRRNLDGALAVKAFWENVIRDRRCVLVDDVVTTGATLAEAARALRRAGAADVVGATMAAAHRTRA